MKILKLTGILLTMLIVLAGCIGFASAPAATTTSRPAAAAPALGPDELDDAIREASTYLNGRIPKGNKVAFINISGGFPDLADYILGDLSKHGVNDGLFSVVDRAMLDQVRAELNFNLSGEVSDQSAQEIGKMLGAQTIVSGSVRRVASLFRLEVKAIEVQTATVQGVWNRNIPNGMTIAALTENTSSPSQAGQAAASGGITQTGTASGGTAQAAAPAYRIGDTGPAGGIVFYDKGNNTGGWRYLEVALVDLGPCVFMTESPVRSGSIGDLWKKSSDDAARAIGKGKFNTEYIIEMAQSIGGGFGWAVQLAASYEYNGFDDWFLPSRDELNYMYGNLFMRGLGDFRPEDYWSSTGFTNDWGSSFGYKMNFGDGKHELGRATDLRCRVRPVRQF